MKKKTLVFGASTNPSRYSYLAVNRLLAYGYEVVAYGNKEGRIKSVEINIGLLAHNSIHTVTLYLNPKNQKPYYDYIMSLNPERVIFNPGTENPEFYNLLEEKDIEYEEACTLVLLSTNQY